MDELLPYDKKAFLLRTAEALSERASFHLAVSVATTLHVSQEDRCLFEKLLLARAIPAGSSNRPFEVFTRRKAPHSTRSARTAEDGCVGDGGEGDLEVFFAAWLLRGPRRRNARRTQRE
jgi:hypothetical protein